MIAQGCKAFMDNEIVPNKEKLGLEKDYQLTRKCLKKAAEQGLYGFDVPEEYGGHDMDFKTGTLCAE
jgi:alkylation response protein AidB-like acyl-CoA dehydrogenase